MSRLTANRSGEMEIFVQVVEAGGFSAAARACAMTPSAVSKLVSRLEERLGVRLVNRSTRKLLLTPEGCAFYERSARILADIEEAERGAAAGAEPSGRLSVTVNVPVGRHVLLPLVSEFLGRHPKVSLDLSLTDEVVDLLARRADVAIRNGPLKASSLVARKLGETPLRIVAAPSYLDRMGVPETPADLARHNMLRFNYDRADDAWPFRVDGEPVSITPEGNARISDGESLRQMAVAGLGLARLADFLSADDLAAGRLVQVLAPYDPGETEEIHALYLGQSGPPPSRVRAFLDFLVDKVRIKRFSGRSSPD